MTDIIGISGGRKGKVTESVVRAVLEGTGRDSETISLAGRLIRPCEACLGCADTNRCVLNDDLQPVLDKMAAAEAVVFGGPTYWGGLHAKARAFWERTCFSGRHNALFPLGGKLGVIVAVDGQGDGGHSRRDLRTFFDDARLTTVGAVSVQGEYACFSCGYGSHCPVGGFKELFPLGTPISDELKPSLINQHPENPHLVPEQRDLGDQARRMGRLLADALNARQRARSRHQS